MAALQDILRYCDKLLEIDKFKDYCPNGLQVAGREEVDTLVSGVSASLALVETAVANHADLLLVHHGYFWKNEDPRVVGMKRRRLAHLLAADLNLVAYHLPLDAHPVYGNNAQLAARLGIQPEGQLPSEPLVCLGRLAHSVSGAEFAARLSAALDRPPLHIAGDPARPLRRVAWCSGGAQGYLEAVAQYGVDAYISGEISESSVHIAREYGVHYYAAGHHATERYGVQALGAHLATHFGLHHHYVELDNPV